MSELQYLKKKK